MKKTGSNKQISWKGIRLGDACTVGATDACIVANSECATFDGTTTCVCSTDFINLSENLCAPSTSRKIGTACVAADSETCFYESERQLITSDCPADGTCICQNSKQRGATCIPIKLDDDTCEDNNECPKRSTCTESGGRKTCTCIHGYSADSENTACALSTSPIAELDECGANAGDEVKCAADLLCVDCGTDTTKRCARRNGLLTEACACASDCASNVAVCVSSVCSCPAGYVAHGQIQCIPTGTFDSVCLADEDCTATIPNTACAGLSCECAATYVRMVDGCIKVGEYTAPCGIINKCDATKYLYCKQGHSSTGCLAAACDCIRGYKRIVDECVLGIRLGGACTVGATDACILANSECATFDGTTTCVCSTDFINLSENLCAPSTSRKIGTACVAADSETCFYESERQLMKSDCPADGTCICQNSKQRGATCIPITIGEDTCEDNNECPKQSSCTETGGRKTCTCIAEYGADSEKTACVLSTNPILAAETCDANGDETKCATGLSCAACGADVSKTCAKRIGLLSESCTSASDCASNVAVCVGSVCACPAGYVAYGKIQCIPTGVLGSVCLADEDCIVTIPNTACTEFVCACAAKYVEDGGVCLQECTSENAATVCPSSINKECDTDSRKCICRTTFISIGSECVSGRMGSKCTDNDHCANLVNSQCKNEQCTCADGLITSGETCGCAVPFKLDNGRCVVESGAGFNAAWLLMIVMSGFLAILSLISF